ncbi:acyltransferase [Pseudomonas zhanjiangensis]|uniref:DapH/DapD/GlmU-related protein n=1 Tax=Pseudomonas zhanjiangensis TaxID=3239015 RepID=A0ABV3YVQ4_9PSED
MWLSNDVEIETATKVYIGEGTSIQRRCTINGAVRIGVGCIFAPNVFVSSGTHPFREVPWLPIREQEKRIIAANGSLASLDRPVWIQDDCWLGINVVVCPGVTIGKGSVVGANSVVVRDVAPYSVVAGAPAKVIGQRLEWCPKQSISADCAEDAPYVISGLLRAACGDVPAGVKVTSEVPFCAILNVGLESFKVRYHLYSTDDVEVMIFGELYSVGVGCSEIEVAVERLKKEGETVCCELAVVSKNIIGRLLVRRIEALL